MKSAMRPCRIAVYHQGRPSFDILLPSQSHWIKIASEELFVQSSREIPWMTSSGSITLPNDFDILRPSESRTREWQYTSEKGILPVIFSPSMIIRATQKKRMSQPVSRIDVGYSVSISCVCSGQPRVEKGHRPEENHVSRTSSSLFNLKSLPDNAFRALDSASSDQILKNSLR